MTPPAPRRPRGLTLIELMIGLAVLAVLASLALPPFGRTAELARLKSTAETLAADLNDARFEAAQRGQALHLQARTGTSWCWSVATTPGCTCPARQACQLKVVDGREHPGIELAGARATRFDPTGTAEAGTAALLQSSRGEQLRVDVSPLGRARICAPGAAVPGYPAC